jgi:hypothetical protein
MPYAPFHERFPEIAEKETRMVTTINHPELPQDEYGLIELYCDEPGCDCRRVMFNVHSLQQREPLAVIAYGWESKEFYAKWFGDDDPEIINELKGPALNAWSRQSNLAPALLRTVTQVLQDRQYVNRLKRHYAMFRREIDREAAEPRKARRRRTKSKRKKRR